MENKNTYFEELAFSYLPIRISEEAKKSAALFRSRLSEIRLRRGGRLALTNGDKNIITSVVCTESDVDYTVRALCGNSLYSHSETIKEGYICTDGGIRAGVCGRAVTESGKVISVTDISSVSIRIPHRAPGASDDICKLIVKEGFRGMIIFSPPGVGKTTALREIVARMGDRPYNVRIAVIDTRFEICGGLGSGLTADCLSGYPRSKGMETALRALSPQLMICDEIGSREDSEAICESFGSGVPCIVSAHAGSIEELKERIYIRQLFELGVFSYAVGLSRNKNGFDVSVYEL